MQQERSRTSRTRTRATQRDALTCGATTARRDTASTCIIMQRLDLHLCNGADAQRGDADELVPTSRRSDQGGYPNLVQTSDRRGGELSASQVQTTFAVLSDRCIYSFWGWSCGSWWCACEQWPAT